MNRIIQEDNTGCGLACVAMVTGKSYQEIKLLAIHLNICNEKGPYYTRAKDICSLLKYYRIGFSKVRHVKNWSSINDNSIVAINYDEKLDTWHWVVYINGYINGYVLDPRKKVKSIERKDWNRMRPRSCIPITI